MQQFKAIANATKYIRSTFEQVRGEFMAVIDHLETESEEKEPETRKEHNEKVEEELKIAYSKVSQEELEVLDEIIKQVGKRFPELETKVLKRTKRFAERQYSSKLLLTILTSRCDFAEGSPPGLMVCTTQERLEIGILYT